MFTDFFLKEHSFSEHIISHRQYSVMNCSSGGGMMHDVHVSIVSPIHLRATGCRHSVINPSPLREATLRRPIFQPPAEICDSIVYHAGADSSAAASAPPLAALCCQRRQMPPVKHCPPPTPQTRHGRRRSAACDAFDAGKNTDGSVCRLCAI